MGLLTQTFQEVQNRLDLIIPKAAGTGHKVDETAPTYPWVDLAGPVIVRSAGSTSPSLSTYITGSKIKEYQMDGNDEVQHTFHMPHDWVPGSDMFLHIHWSHNTTDTPTGDMTWGFEVSYSKGHDQEAFSAVINPTCTQAVSSTQYFHQICEFQLTSSSPSATQLDTADLEPDGLLLVTTYIDTNSTSPSINPFLHFVDLHYQSTSIGTKDKAPNFYE